MNTCNSNVRYIEFELLQWFWRPFFTIFQLLFYLVCFYFSNKIFYQIFAWFFTDCLYLYILANFLSEGRNNTKLTDASMPARTAYVEIIPIYLLESFMCTNHAWGCGVNKWCLIISVWVFSLYHVIDRPNKIFKELTKIGHIFGK